jgi:hypothetical protein
MTFSDVAFNDMAFNDMTFDHVHPLLLNARGFG